MSVTKTTVIAVIVVVLTFVAGVAVGVFSSHVMMLRGGHGAPPFPARAMVNRLDRHLDLTDAQRAKVQEIIERRHARIAETWSSVRPRVSEEIARTNAEIYADAVVVDSWLPALVWAGSVLVSTFIGGLIITAILYIGPWRRVR